MPVGKTELNIPLEVVDHIFKYCKFSLTGNKYRFLPNMCLYPLLFVCTEWHAFAERRLYSSVGLGDEKLGTDEDGDLIKINGKDVCDMFYGTVSANPRLASLVRELRLSTKEHAQEETEQHIALIKLCKNVEHVEIAGYNGYVLDELNAALANVDLVSLSVFGRGRGDWKDSRSHCHPDWLKCMLNWPRLEKIDIANSTMTDRGPDGATFPEPSAVAGRCPALKEYTARKDRLTSVHLNLLSEMTHEMEHLAIEVQADSALALTRCIQTWSNTLKHLSLAIYGDTTCSLETVASALVELRFLKVASIVIPPSSFLRLEHLESVIYFASAEDAKALARLIRKKDILPALRNLTCHRIVDDQRGSSDLPERYEDKLFPGAIKGLREACNARNVSFYASFMIMDGVGKHHRRIADIADNRGH